MRAEARSDAVLRDIRERIEQRVPDLIDVSGFLDAFA